MEQNAYTCPQTSCLTKGLVYEAKVTKTSDQSTETYTGLTSRRFKDRFYEHTSNSNNESDKDKTTLSSHIWNLKRQGDPYTTSWRIIDRGKSFNPSTKSCQVCLKEKYHIMFSSEGATLNSRREIFSTCRHRTKQLLCNSWKPVSFLFSTENYTSISVNLLFYVKWWACYVIRNKFVLI